MDGRILRGFLIGYVGIGELMFAEKGLQMKLWPSQNNEQAAMRALANLKLFQKDCEINNEKRNRVLRRRKAAVKLHGAGYFN